MEKLKSDPDHWKARGKRLVSTWSGSFYYKPKKNMRTIQISDECFEKLKDQLLPEEQVDISKLDEMIGRAYFFRTVTYHMTGRVKRIIGNILVLTDAAWIADSGRFMDCIKSGKLHEVEPVGNAYLNLSTCVDFFDWKHELPKTQK